MKEITALSCRVLGFILAGMLLAEPVLADKPDQAGKGSTQAREDRGRAPHRDNDGGAQAQRADSRHFSDRQKVAVREYYEEPLPGRCPPGLAKKRNGCIPPGQAKKWLIGRPLPRGVVFYTVPPVLVTQIGQPPQQHKYVRVAGDILLIAIGTRMVVDAIEDLGRR